MCGVWLNMWTEPYKEILALSVLLRDPFDSIKFTFTAESCTSLSWNELRPGTPTFASAGQSRVVASTPKLVCVLGLRHGCVSNLLTVPPLKWCSAGWSSVWEGANGVVIMGSLRREHHKIQRGEMRPKNLPRELHKRRMALRGNHHRHQHRRWSVDTEQPG